MCRTSERYTIIGLDTGLASSSSKSGTRMSSLTSSPTERTCAARRPPGAFPFRKEISTLRKQTIRIEPITLAWTRWHDWDSLRRRSNSVGGIAITQAGGVYEIRHTKSSEPIYIGCTNRLWRRLKVLLRGKHKPGFKILNSLRTNALKIRWAETQRPACIEEELLNRFQRRHRRLPRFNSFHRATRDATP